MCGSLRVLQVNAISIHVKRYVWSPGLIDTTQPSNGDEVSYELGGGKQPRNEFNTAATTLKDLTTSPENL